MTVEFPKGFNKKSNESLNLEKIKESTNEQNYAFQALTYLYEASAKLAISNTLLSTQQNVNTSTVEQLRAIQASLNEFEDKLCQLTK